MFIFSGFRCEGEIYRPVVVYFVRPTDISFIQLILQLFPVFGVWPK